MGLYQEEGPSGGKDARGVDRYKLVGTPHLGCKHVNPRQNFKKKWTPAEFKERKTRWRTLVAHGAVPCRAAKPARAWCVASWQLTHTNGPFLPLPSNRRRCFLQEGGLWTHSEICTQILWRTRKMDLFYFSPGRPPGNCP